MKLAHFVIAACLGTATLSGQEVVGSYPFTNASLASTDKSKDTDASIVSFGERIHARSGRILLDEDDWEEARRGSKQYSKNHIQLQITPRNKMRLTALSISFDLWRDEDTLIRQVDVRVDEDPGQGGDNFRSIVKSIDLPEPSQKLQRTRHTITLDHLPQLRDCGKPMRLRLHFFGAEVNDESSTWIDDVTVNGSCRRESSVCTDLALYGFQSGSLASSDKDAKSSASNAKFANKVSFVSDYALLGRADWKPSNRGQAAYEANAVDFTITPEALHRSSVEQIQFRIWRDADSSICWIDIRADEDPGTGGDNFKSILNQTFLGEPTGTGAWTPVTIDVSRVALLQNAVQPLTIRVHLWGECTTKDWSDSRLDDLAACGKTSECVRASVRALGAAGCDFGNEIALTGMPAFGTTPVLNVTTRGSRDPFLIYISEGASTGALTFPGTSCKIWINLRNYTMWSKFTLDANGRGSVKLPIPTNLAGIAGVEFGVQGLLWQASGDSLSNSLMLKLGCK